MKYLFIILIAVTLGHSEFIKNWERVDDIVYFAMATDANDCIYGYGNCNESDKPKIATIRVWGPDNQQLLNVPIQNSIETDPLYGNIVVDAAKNIYCAYVADNESMKTQALVIVKISNSGQQLWLNRIQVSEFYGNKGPYLALGQCGDIAVTANNYNGASYMRIVTAVFDSAGTKRWEKTYSGTYAGITQPFGLVVDDSGDVVVAGEESESQYVRRPLLLKYKRDDGQLLKEIKLDRGQVYPFVKAVDFDSKCNVYFAGHLYVNQFPHYNYFKLDTSGAVVWEKTFRSTMYTEMNPTVFINDNDQLFCTWVLKNQDTGIKYSIVYNLYNADGGGVWSYTWPYHEKGTMRRSSTMTATGMAAATENYIVRARDYDGYTGGMAQGNIVCGGSNCVYISNWEKKILFKFSGEQTVGMYLSQDIAKTAIKIFPNPMHIGQHLVVYGVESMKIFGINGVFAGTNTSVLGSGNYIIWGKVGPKTIAKTLTIYK